MTAVGLGDRLSHSPPSCRAASSSAWPWPARWPRKPAVLFADEPTGNLDSATGDEVLRLLRRSAEEFGQTIVMVTHDARAATFADRVVFLKDGAHQPTTAGGMSRDEIYDTIKSLEATSGTLTRDRRDDPQSLRTSRAASCARS